MIRVRAAVVAALSVLLGIGFSSPASAADSDVYCASVTPVSQRPTLARGDLGWCVKELQHRLRSRGEGVAVDGDFGPGTQAAVRAVQGRAGLRRTGVVDDRTWAALIGRRLEIPRYTPERTYITQRGPNRTARVILSYDDCPRSAAAFRDFVDEARRLRVTTVLLPTGDCVRSGRVDVRYARDRGQVVVGHTETHPNLLTLDDDAVRRQVDRQAQASGYLRPPYGSYDSRVRRAVATEKVRLWMWTRDTGDWAGYSRAHVIRQVTEKARPNDTILMHMQWNGFSPTALRAMKAGLADRGISLCRAYPDRPAPAELPEQLPC